MEPFTQLSFTLLNDNCAQTVWKKQTEFHNSQKLVLDDRRLLYLVVLYNAQILINEWNLYIYFSKEHQRAKLAKLAILSRKFHRCCISHCYHEHIYVWKEKITNTLASN